MNGDDLQRALGRLEGKVDGLTVQITQLLTMLTAHAARLRALERWKAWMTGAGVVLGAVGGWAVKALWGG